MTDETQEKTEKLPETPESLASTVTTSQKTSEESVTPQKSSDTKTSSPTPSTSSGATNKAETPEDDKLSPAAIAGIIVVTAVLIMGVYFFVTGDGATASLPQSNATVASATTTASGTAAPSANLENGKAAPQFELKDHTGNTVSLASLKGKPSMIIFEATWCTFCQRENADIERIKSEYSDALQVVTIDMREDLDTIKSSVAARGITRPFLVDTDGAVGTTYAVTGTPTHYFIDADGNIAQRRVGLMTYDQLKQTVDSII